MADQTSFLHDFLELQLLDIGDDDARLDSLHAASMQIRDALNVDRHALSRYTRVALDANIAPTEPVFDDVEGVIKQHWRTIRNKHTSRPVSIIRAVLWEAIRESVEHDTSAAVVWLTAKAARACTHLGPERTSCLGFLNQLASRVEQAAEHGWMSNGGGTDPPSDKPAADLPSLATQLLAACGPDGPSGPVKGANPHWPAANAQWSAEFSQRAAKGISESLCIPWLGDTVAALRTANFVLGRKIDLLWWNEAAYCVSLKTSFDGLDAAHQAFFLAGDLWRIAGNVTPTSTDHFLREVVSAAGGTEPVLLVDFVATMAASPHRSVLVEILEATPNGEGRTGLLGCVKQNLEHKTPPAVVADRLGVAPDASVPLPELAQFVLWEMQCQSLSRRAD